MINIKRVMRHLDELARFNITPGEGVTRPSFTPEDRLARRWFLDKAAEMGMTTRTDGAGNIFARSAWGSGPALLAGSHLDTVPNGGRLDGALGVVLALEVAAQLNESGTEASNPFEVVVWADEEGARFSTGLFGSRAAIGEVTEAELKTTRDRDGVLLADAIVGFAQGDIGSARLSPQEYLGYFEVHIEQGARLIEEGYDIGIVQGIVGISRLSVALSGQANHAGTTPMNRRRDALYGAARVVLAVRELGLANMPGVATVGVLRPQPGAVNVIPGRVDLSIELRHLTREQIDRMVAEAEAMVRSIAAAEGLVADVQRIKSSQPSPTDPAFSALLMEESGRLGLKALELPSGAGHDAQNLARIMPIGMLFVPSIGGISHSPLEDSREEDIRAAGDVLFGAISRTLGVPKS